MREGEEGGKGRKEEGRWEGREGRRRRRRGGGRCGLTLGMLWHPMCGASGIEWP